MYEQRAGVLFTADEMRTALDLPYPLFIIGIEYQGDRNCYRVNVAGPSLPAVPEYAEAPLLTVAELNS